MNDSLPLKVSTLSDPALIAEPLSERATRAAPISQRL